MVYFSIFKLEKREEVEEKSFKKPLHTKRRAKKAF